MFKKKFIFFIILFKIIFIYPQNKGLDIAINIQDKFNQIIEKVTPAYVSIAGGAGVIISEDGYVLTNNHVVSSMKYLELMTGKSKKYRAKVIGRDVKGDLALLKIDSNQKFSFLKLANFTNLKIGQIVLSFGNPFVYSNSGDPSVSFGIISGLNQTEGNYFFAIQTDAALNPGNSGGPLVNIDGEIVGINGRIATRFKLRRNTKVGYAISCEQIKNFIPFLKTNKLVFHGTISGLKLSKQSFWGRGVLVEAVMRNSNALKAGFRPGDIIVKINEYNVFNINIYNNIIWLYPANTEITCKINREKRFYDIKIKLEKNE